MKISSAQMHTFEVEALASFERRLTEHWKRNFPHRFRSLSDEQIRAIARAAIQEAREQGIRAERDIATYVDLCLAVRTGFAARM